MNLLCGDRRYIAHCIWEQRIGRRHGLFRHPDTKKATPVLQPVPVGNSETDQHTAARFSPSINWFHSCCAIFIYLFVFNIRGNSQHHQCEWAFSAQTTQKSFYSSLIALVGSGRGVTGKRTYYSGFLTFLLSFARRVSHTWGKSMTKYGERIQPRQKIALKANFGVVCNSLNIPSNDLKIKMYNLEYYRRRSQNISTVTVWFVGAVLHSRQGLTRVLAGLFYRMLNGKFAGPLTYIYVEGRGVGFIGAAGAVKSQNRFRRLVCELCRTVVRGQCSSVMSVPY